MLWWLGTVASAIAAFKLWPDNRGLAWVAILVAVVGLWTAGIASNFRSGQEQAIPNAATKLNIGSVISGIVLLIISFAVA